MVQVGQDVERAVVAFLERRVADSGRAGPLGAERQFDSPRLVGP